MALPSDSNWRKATHAMQIHEEWHVTVIGDVPKFREACAFLGVKPLWIELNTFERQLMCAAKYDVSEALQRRGFEIVRVKHEMQPAKLDITTHGDTGKRWLEVPSKAIYYECHAKFDGPFRPAWHMSSRDLLREDRWYVTRREAEPFEEKPWLDMVQGWAFMSDGFRGPSCLAGWEYEAAVLDTNPKLDEHWSAFTR